MFKAEEFGAEIADLIRLHVAAEMAKAGQAFTDRLAPLAEDLDAMKTAIANLPAPRDGKDGADGKAGETGAPGVDGKDGDPGQPGADGKDGQDGKDGAQGIQGKDGLGLTAAMITREGGLVLTLSDGTTKDVGMVVGKDGAPGKDGAAGADGLGFEDMTEELADDGRTIIRRYQRGDLIKEFRHTFAVVLDRNIFKDGNTYVPGDGVTYGGSFWIAQKEDPGVPGDGPGWRLAVKRGQNGRDAKTETTEHPKPVRLK
jgi:hypothetical protein